MIPLPIGFPRTDPIIKLSTGPVEKQWKSWGVRRVIGENQSLLCRLPNYVSGKFLIILIGY
jgi:hypothetical protein